MRRGASAGRVAGGTVLGVKGSQSLQEVSTRELVSRLAGRGSELVRKEVALAKTELRADLRTEIRAASGLGVAGLCLVLTVQLLLVAGVLALQEAGVMTGWQAALAVAAAVLLAGTLAGIFGWRGRVRNPLEATRRTARDGLRWAKEQVR